MKKTFRLLLVVLLLFTTIHTVSIGVNAVQTKTNYTYEKYEKLNALQKESIIQEIPIKENLKNEFIQIVYDRADGYVSPKIVYDDFLLVVIIVLLSLLTLYILLKKERKRSVYIVAGVFILLFNVFSIYNFLQNFKNLSVYDKTLETQLEPEKISKFKYIGYLDRQDCLVIPKENTTKKTTTAKPKESSTTASEETTASQTKQTNLNSKQENQGQSNQAHWNQTGVAKPTNTKKPAVQNTKTKTQVIPDITCIKNAALSLQTIPH